MAKIARNGGNGKREMNFMIYNLQVVLGQNLYESPKRAIQT